MTENEHAKTFNSQLVFTNQRLHDRKKDFTTLQIEHTDKLLRPEKRCSFSNLVDADIFRPEASFAVSFSAVSVDHVTVVLQVKSGPPLPSLSLPLLVSFSFVSRHWLKGFRSCDWSEI